MTDAVPPAGKLVRDRIPEIIKQSGRQPVVVRLSEDRRRPALLAKLREECDELAAAPSDEVLGELADVLEVLRALAATSEYSWADVEEAARHKTAQRGAFTKAWYLLDSG